MAHPADKIEYARLLHLQGNSLGQIETKTGIPKTSLHRYLDRTPRGTTTCTECSYQQTNEADRCANCDAPISNAIHLAEPCAYWPGRSYVRSVRPYQP